MCHGGESAGTALPTGTTVCLLATTNETRECGDRFTPEPDAFGAVIIGRLSWEDR